MVRHFLDISDLDSITLRSLIEAGRLLKRQRRTADMKRPLAGRTLAMIFDKPSTRTRVSFDVAMRELGGESIMLTMSDMQIGRGETIGDTARVMSRYVDGIVIRTHDHQTLAELAANATIPVINGLTGRSHPCQVMADVMTFEEHKGSIEGRLIAWLGDANNVCASFVHAAARFRFRLNVGGPTELAVKPALLDWAKRNGAAVATSTDAATAAKDADCIVTDTWVSMGDGERDRRHNLLRPYQVDAKLMAVAAKGAIFMHCLPAHRGEEVTSDVLDGPQSVVFDEAENRLHAQKAILAWCMAGEGSATQ
jgi:ornithine carbamoyltransferase